ncbi:DUF1183-domain-containing protein [Pilatotrama ljubarskyi]|nr:DUF1183-domain-containing protein [Pilatotrama ljubarskyi]
MDPNPTTTFWTRPRHDCTRPPPQQHSVCSFISHVPEPLSGSRSQQTSFILRSPLTLTTNESAMSRVALAKIPALTFYKDELTLARRAPPIPQLTCIGKPCRLYQPDVVRCVNIGGSGTDVDWKCEADLPESLRFGRVEVSCEGWDGPGDPYVLKGSCGLEYRLVQVPSSLRGPGAEDPSYPARFSSWLSTLAQDPAAAFFILLWVAALGLILYNLLSSCLRPRHPPGTSPNGPRRPWWGSGPGSGWFSGSRPDAPDPGPDTPPPPYSKHPPPTTTGAPPAQGEGWRPGFWTGAALGGLGAYLFNRPARPPREYDPYLRARPAMPGLYDWEAERAFRPPPSVRYGPSSAGSWFGAGMGARRRGGWESEDRGEGPSNLGSMRRSTGLGGSSVR